MMRIGLITGEYPPMQGGVGAYTQVLAGAFARQGQEVFIFSRAGTRSDNPALHLTDGANGWGIDSLRAVRQWARRQQPDILDLQYQTAAFDMSPFVHFLPHVVRDIPLVTTFHDLRFPYLFPKAGGLRDWIVMHLARASDGVITTNHEDAERLQHLPHHALIAIGSNIAAPVPNPGDCRAWRARAGAAPDEFLLVHFGFVNRSKGLETLLESLARLRGDGLPVKLVMLGGRTGTSDVTNAGYAAEIDARIASLRLSACVHWTGYVDDEAVSAYLRAGDAVVLPYRDGASYRRGSLMAAIQHGCAIITTRPRVAVPAFVDGENMLLAPSDDVEGLANCIRALYDSPRRRSRLREGAGQLAHRFDWSHITAGQIAFFERVMGSVK